MPITKRLDGWKTLATDAAAGAQTLLRKAKGLQYQARPDLTRYQLESLYQQSSLVARVIDLIVDDSMSGSWEMTDVELKGGGKFNSEAFRDRLDAELAPEDQTLDLVVSTAAKWARLYGGSLLVVPMVDGETPDNPIGKNIERVAPLIPVASADAIPTRYDNVFGSGTFGQTLEYQVSVGHAQEVLNIHHSRVVRFDPIRLPGKDQQQTSDDCPWGHSEVERIYDDLSGYGAAKGHSLSQMFVGSLLFLKMSGYRARASEKGGRELTRDLMEDFSSMLSSLRAFPIDAEDDVQTVQHGNPGASATTGDMKDGLGAAVDMPREIFFNESPAGLNAGELSGPRKIWNSKVESYRERQLEPQIRRVIDLAARAWGIPLVSYEIKWPDLWTPSSTETSAVSRTNAETDNLYYQMGALSEDEVRNHRFVDGSDAPIEITKSEDQDLALDLDVTETPTEETGAPNESRGEGLTGIQISSLVGVVEKVQMGAIPWASGVEILKVAFPSHAAAAEGLLGPMPATGAAPVQVAGAAPTPAAPVEIPTTDAAPEDLLSPRDAAAKFGIPTRAITRQIELGSLRFWGLGAHKRVSMADVMQLAKKHEETEEEEEEDDGTEETDA